MQTYIDMYKFLSVHVYIWLCLLVVHVSVYACACFVYSFSMPTDKYIFGWFFFKSKHFKINCGGALWRLLL